MEISKQLINGVKKRKHSSQRRLYEITLPYFIVVCNRYLIDSNNRNDVLQETMIRIFSKIEHFNPDKGEFKSWARRILINECFRNNDYVKKSQEVSTDLNSATFEMMSISPQVISHLNVEELVTFLKNMPRELYDVFNLYVIDGYSHPEVSEILVIKSSLSRKRLERAREWLNRNETHINTYQSKPNFQ